MEVGNVSCLIELLGGSLWSLDGVQVVEWILGGQG